MEALTFGMALSRPTASGLVQLLDGIGTEKGVGTDAETCAGT